MTEIVAQVLPGHPAGVLAGPNIAKEVMTGYAAPATIAMPDQTLAARWADLFRTTRFRIYSTTDVVGVEIAGALKNVFAIAAGMADGAGAGYNTKAMVITRAVREMRRLREALGGDPLTFSGLAGTGDLIVTCTSPLSRNRHIGEELGRGKSIVEVLAGMKQVAEGVKAAPVVMKLAADVGVDMRIAQEVDNVLWHHATVQDAYRGLLTVAPAVQALAAGVVEQPEGAAIARAHTAGNSPGGWIALELARRGRARSVVLFGPAGAWRSKARMTAVATGMRLSFVLLARQAGRA